MDGELVRRLYHVCGTVASRAPGRRCGFSDFEVLVTFVLAAVARRAAELGVRAVQPSAPGAGG